jgi:hypothetical protein
VPFCIAKDMVLEVNMLNKMLKALMKELDLKKDELFMIEGYGGTYWFDSEGLKTNDSANTCKTELAALIEYDLRITKVDKPVNIPKTGEVYYYIDLSLMRILAATQWYNTQQQQNLLKYDLIRSTEEEAKLRFEEVKKTLKQLEKSARNA